MILIRCNTSTQVKDCRITAVQITFIKHRKFSNAMLFTEILWAEGAITTTTYDHQVARLPNRAEASRTGFLIDELWIVRI